jgi:hypothetical protein
MAGTDPYTSLYPTSSSGKELNLRTEFYRTLFGAVDEEAKGREGLLRKMRRDSDGNPIRCVCRDIVTDEPDKDYYCRYCLGMGYYWDEIKIIYFRNDNSFRKREGKNEEFEGDDFFLQYDVEVTPADYIVTVILDTEGNPSSPITRNKFFKILSADSFRSDNGRIEFWRVRAIEERKWSVWYGNQNRQHN